MWLLGPFMNFATSAGRMQRFSTFLLGKGEITWLVVSQ